MIATITGAKNRGKGKRARREPAASRPYHFADSSHTARFSPMHQELIDMPDVLLWDRRLPVGHVTLLAGPPGVGKSLVTLDLAARLSRGHAWPGGSVPDKPRRSVLLMDEDYRWTIQRRLIAANADMERVLRLENICYDDDPVRPNLMAHASAIVQTLKPARDWGLMIIDPLPAFAGRCDLNHPRHARQMMQRLHELAGTLGVAIIAITHLNKMPGGKGLERAMGSVALAAVAREVHFILPDPNDPGRRLFLPVKQNLAARTPALAYRVISDAQGRAKIEWEDSPLPDRVDEVLSAGRGDRASPALEVACDFLMRELASGPQLVSELVDAGRRAGVSFKTLKRAKQAMCVEAVRHGFGPGARFEWRLPAELQVEAPIKTSYNA